MSAVGRANKRRLSDRTTRRPAGRNGVFGCRALRMQRAEIRHFHSESGRGCLRPESEMGNHKELHRN